MTPEGRVKVKVRKLLDLMIRQKLSIYAFMPVQRGLGASALDYYCCISGWFVAIETKVPGKKLTLRQVITAKEIAAARGLVCVVRNDDDIIALAAMLWEKRESCIYDVLGSKEIYGELWCR